MSGWLGVDEGGRQNRRRRGRRSLEERIRREPEEEAADVDDDDPIVNPDGHHGIVVVLHVPFACPYCLQRGETGRPVETRGRTKDGRKRYHFCPRCEVEFDSLERQTKVIGRRR